MKNTNPDMLLIGVMLFCFCVVLWFGFDMDLSLSFGISVFAGFFSGLWLVVSTRREEQYGDDDKAKQKFMPIIFGPLLGIIIVGILRLFGAQNILALAVSAASAMMAVFLFWFNFLRTYPFRG